MHSRTPPMIPAHYTDCPVDGFRIRLRMIGMYGRLQSMTFSFYFRICNILMTQSSEITWKLPDSAYVWSSPGVWGLSENTNSMKAGELHVDEGKSKPISKVWSSIWYYHIRIQPIIGWLMPQHNGDRLFPSSGLHWSINHLIVFQVEPMIGSMVAQGMVHYVYTFQFTSSWSEFVASLRRLQ